MTKINILVAHTKLCSIQYNQGVEKLKDQAFIKLVYIFQKYKISEFIRREVVRKKVVDFRKVFIGKLPMLETMSRVVKVIKGRKYVYDVKWDSEIKKQIWTYKGKVGAKKRREIDKEKLKRELYHTIKNDRILNISKRDLKRIRNLIDKTLNNL